MTLKDLKPRIFLEYRWETVEVSYEEAELVAFVTRFTWAKIRQSGMPNIEQMSKRLDEVAGVNWKYRAPYFTIQVGKKKEALSPHYAFLLFLGEKAGWDEMELIPFFGSRDLSTVIHALKKLLPFLDVSPAKKRSLESVTQRLREAGLLEKIGEREIKIKLEKESKKRLQEQKEIQKRLEKEEKARKKAEEDATERIARQQYLDKKLLKDLREMHRETRERKYALEAVELAHGTEYEKEVIRKRYSEKIKEFKKAKRWE